MQEATWCLGDGWIRIGRWDGARERSLWVRLTFMGPPHLLVGENGAVLGMVDGPCVSIELCSGRQGSDDYVQLLPTDMADEWTPGRPSIYSLLLSVLTTQLWSQARDRDVPARV